MCRNVNKVLNGLKKQNKNKKIGREQNEEATNLQEV